MLLRNGVFSLSRVFTTAKTGGASRGKSAGLAGKRAAVPLHPVDDDDTGAKQSKSRWRDEEREDRRQMFADITALVKAGLSDQTAPIAAPLPPPVLRMQAVWQRNAKVHARPSNPPSNSRPVIRIGLKFTRVVARIQPCSVDVTIVWSCFGGRESVVF